MNVIKPVTVLYLIFFLALFVWAAMADPKLAGFIQSLNQPWAVVVLMDFVFGCLLLSWMIYFVEGSARAALPWIIALFIVGNIVGAIYVLLRIERIRQRLSPQTT